MNIIEKIIEPKSLLLAWQAPESIDISRRRKVIGILEKNDNNLITFRYIPGEDLEEAILLGFQSYGIFNKFNKIYTEGVMEEFARRLPQKNRKDYKQFLRSIRIQTDANISDFTLLGYSGGLLPSDSFSLVNRFEHVEGDCQMLQEVAGFRYHMNTKSGNIFMEMALGDPVTLCPEPTNPHDPDAVKVIFNGKTIGYINKILAPTFQRWFKARTVKANIEKVAGTVERPRVFLFITVS